jgi:hypothetical protein
MSETTTPNKRRELMLDITEINTKRGALDWAHEVFEAYTQGQIKESDVNWLFISAKQLINA